MVQSWEWLTHRHKHTVITFYVFGSNFICRFVLKRLKNETFVGVDEGCDVCLAKNMFRNKVNMITTINHAQNWCQC